MIVDVYRTKREPFNTEEIRKMAVQVLSDLGIKKAKNFLLSIYVVKMTGDEIYGYSGGDWWSKQFEGDIEIKSGLSRENFIITLAHELTHVKQYYRKELVIHKTGFVWRGQEYAADTPYEDRPWENEAYDFENKYLQVFNNGI